MTRNKEIELTPPTSLNPFSDYLVQEIEKPERINDLFEYKHRPKKLDDFVGNKLNVSFLNGWIKAEDFSVKRIILLYGPPGIGKTVLSRLLLKDYNMILCDSHNMSDKNAFFERIKKILTTISIESSLFNTKKSSIIIDNIDKNLGEGVYYKKFMDIVEKHNKNNIPIICISSSKKLKKKYNTPSKNLICLLDYPTQKDMTNYCNKIMKIENIDVTNDALKWIIASSRYDFRKILQTFKLLTLSKKKKKKYNKKDIQLILQFSESDIFFSAVEVLDEAFNDNINRDIQDLMSICYSDQPLIIDLLYSNINQCLDIEQIANVLDGYSDSDVFQTYIYKNKVWDLREYAISSSCIKTIDYIKKNRKNKIYKLKKNQLNNLPWSCIKNQRIFSDIKSLNKNLKTEEYQYAFKNIIKPQLEPKLDNLQENKEEILDIIKLSKDIGINYSNYNKIRNISLFDKPKALNKKKKSIIENLYKELE